MKLTSYEKLEVRLEPNLVYWYNMGTFIWSWGQRSHTMVKGHLRSSCKIGWKCENCLIWKVEVCLEPNLVYWYNMGTFVCSCGQRSQIKVKGHLRSKDVRYIAHGDISRYQSWCNISDMDLQYLHDIKDLVVWPNFF